MALIYNNLQKGARGNNVLALQGALKNNGYDVPTSGDFDDATEAALRQYQQSNGLTVDGIAGNDTLDKLYSASATIQPTRYGYTPSSAVVQAQKYLEGVQQQKPGEYQSKYTDQLQGLLQQIQGRAPFSYDPNKDPLYGIYSTLYTNNGRRAMMDTMGQAAALTGGYANSYMQTAGQQMYNQYMDQLAARIPELEARAYQRYGDEGDRMLQNYQMMQQQENQDYGRYRDTYNDWLTDLQLAQQGYDSEYSRDYTDWGNDRSDAYKLALSILNMGQMPSDDLLARSGISREDAELLAGLAGASTAKGGGGSGGGTASTKKKGSSSKGSGTKEEEETATSTNTGLFNGLFNEALNRWVDKAIDTGENMALKGETLNYPTWVPDDTMTDMAGMALVTLAQRGAITEEEAKEKYAKVLLANQKATAKPKTETAAKK